MESQRLGHNWSNLAHMYAWKSWQQVILWKYKPDQRTPLFRLSSGSLCHWGSQNSYNGPWGQTPSHPWYLSDFISHRFPSFTPHVGLFFFLESPKHMPASECLQLCCPLGLTCPMPRKPYGLSLSVLQVSAQILSYNQPCLNYLM